MKRCSVCGVEKELSCFSRRPGRGPDARHSRCSECARGASREWYRNNVGKARAANDRWRDRNADRVIGYAVKRNLALYGMDEAAWNGMLAAQGGVCALCRKAFDGSVRGLKPYIDHDHATGKVRGLIHSQCNVGLGMFKDDPTVLRLAAEYLERS